MITLVMLVLTSIIAAFFATQNTALVSLTLGKYHLVGVPMYLIVLGSLLIGLLVSAIINWVNTLAASLEIHGKDSKIRESKKTVAELMKQVHQLELENTEYKTLLKKMPDEKSL